MQGLGFIGLSLLGLRFDFEAQGSEFVCANTELRDPNPTLGLICRSFSVQSFCILRILPARPIQKLLIPKFQVQNNDTWSLGVRQEVREVC